MINIRNGKAIVFNNEVMWLIYSHINNPCWKILSEDPKYIRFGFEKEGDFSMAQPKKQTSPRKQGLRRSHLVLKLARRVNAMSPVKVKTTKRETGKTRAQ